jgi:predicted O-methyltransferase YrrM
MMGASFLYRSKVLQHAQEHARFISILQEEGVRSYLEIGSMYGGSLWKVARALPAGSRVVSVDYPVDTPAARVDLDACIVDLRGQGYDAHLISGDSADPEVIAAAWELAPFDAVFIDGAHTLEAVTSDWKNYGRMGKIVAFHDISWNATWRSAVPDRAFKAMGVPELWNRIKVDFKHEEIQFHTPRNYYGIGVLWREP